MYVAYKQQITWWLPEMMFWHNLQIKITTEAEHTLYRQYILWPQTEPTEPLILYMYDKIYMCIWGKCQWKTITSIMLLHTVVDYLPAPRHRDDILAQPPDQDYNRDRRHTAYRQYILWRHGFLLVEGCMVTCLLFNSEDYSCDLLVV
jgi:hypothetical protein